MSVQADKIPSLVNTTTARLFEKGLRRVRQKLISNASLEEVLDSLISTVEEQFPDLIGSVLLLDKEKKCLHHGSAAGLPTDYCQAIDGLLIGPEVGSCGTAAFTGKRVIVEDIGNHPYWEPFKELALKAGVHACWSQPILSSDDKVLGTFALYYREPKTPTQSELDLLEAVAEIAGIAIEMKRESEALDETEERFRTMADYIPNLAWMARADGWIFWYNKRWYEYTGTTPKDMEGWGWQSVHDPAELPRVMEGWTNSINSGERFDMVFPIKGADGVFRPFLTRVEPVKDSDGKIVRWFGTNTDISEHQNTKSALEESERRYRLLVSGIKDYAIFMEDPNGLITSWDEGAQRMFGYQAEEVLGQPFSIFHPPEAVKAGLMQRELEIAAKQGYFESEGWRLRKDSSSFMAKAVLRAVYDGQNSLIGFAKIVQDITEQKQAEDKILESHQLMRMVSYAQGLFFSNQNIYDMFEEPLQQLLNFTQSEYGFIGEILHDDAGQPYLKCNFLTNIAWDEDTKRLWEENRKSGFEFHKLDNLFGHAIRTGEVVIANNTAKDPRRSPQGRPKGHPPLETFLGMPFYKNGVMIGLVGIANRPEGYDQTLVDKLKPFLDACANIIEAYRNQQRLQILTEELQKNEAQLRAIMDTTPECIKIVSGSGTLEYMNASGLSMVEADSNVLGQACVFDVIAPEDRDDWIENHKRICNGESFSWEFDIIGLKGTRRSMETHAVPLPAPDGTISQLAVTRNITERKRKDEALRRYAAKLERSNQELDQFAAMAAHDLQAPLRKVQMFTDHLRLVSEESLPLEALDDIDRIQKATTRMQNLITDLLALSRVNRKGAPFVKGDLAQVLKDVVDDLKADIDEMQAEIDIGQLPALEMDATQMRQLFQNLIQNAMKFHRTDVAPIVKIYAFKANGAYSQIVVEDNGIGLKEEYKDRIFEVFQRLHGENAYPGTGIGLSICKKIIERHNGSIEVESTPGIGTRFIVKLPVRQEASVT